MRLAAAVAVLTLLASPALACGVGSGSRGTPPAAKKVAKNEAPDIRTKSTGCLMPKTPGGPVRVTPPAQS